VPGSNADDAHYMAIALRLAERGRYTAQPNPRVGALVVSGGVVVGEGYHVWTGGPHAEALALQEAGDMAKGATVYCTLEPCSFQGRTPSCARSLIDKGVAEVVYGMVDPHPQNQGKGLQMLRDAGIKVTGPVLETSARAVNPGHVKRHEAGLPFVRLKLAMSLDGKIALANGDSRWITGSAARRDVQKLRARSSALVTGVGTVNQDDPALNVRPGELDISDAQLSAGLPRPVVILDSRLRVRRDAKLLSDPSLIIVCAEAIDDPHLKVETWVAPLADNGGLDLRYVLERLAEMECSEVLFECGPTLAGSVLQAGLVDELIVYMAPRIMGSDARSLLHLEKIGSMRDVLNMDIQDIRKVGDDIRITLTP
jgi:diaminohydroxyphosphoribosylaminopyrimidine deaminase/5-amino-6-(5-phosphoribosylamino)uracil reductase